MPDDGTGLMSIIEQDQLYWAYQPLNAIPVNVPNGSGVHYDEVDPVLAGTDLYLEGGRVAGGGGYYWIPTSPSLKASAGAYVGNMLYGYIDDTDSIIPDGLPTQAATALGAMARIATTLLHRMRDTGAKLGLATMCIGQGQGATTIFEAC